MNFKKHKKTIIIVLLSFAAIITIYIYRFGILLFVFGSIIEYQDKQNEKRLFHANLPLILHECDSLIKNRNNIQGDTVSWSKDFFVLKRYRYKDGINEQIPPEINKINPYDLWIFKDRVMVRLCFGDRTWIEAFPKDQFDRNDSILIPNLWLRMR